MNCPGIGISGTQTGAVDNDINLLGTLDLIDFGNRLPTPGGGFLGICRDSTSSSNLAIAAGLLALSRAVLDRTDSDRAARV